jgi:bruno
MVCVSVLFFYPPCFIIIGLSAQSDSQAAAAAAGLLAPMSVQNLVTLAAMSQPSMQAANSPTAAQLTNAAQSLCK